MKWFKTGPKKIFIHGGGKIGLHDWKTKADLWRESEGMSQIMIDHMILGLKADPGGILTSPPFKRFTRLGL